MTTPVPAPRPKESVFYPAVVYLLGRLTGFKPYVGISHELLQDDVLRLSGFEVVPATDEHPGSATDPDGNSWPLRCQSSKTRDGLYRVVHFAWYHQTRQYQPSAKALCAKPIVGKRGEWALTELGARRARDLREIFEGKIALSAGPNTTAQYIGNRFKTLYDRVTLHLRRKMPRSDQFDKIDDHAMNWFERVIQRDGLRTRLEQGRTIPPSQVCAWARRGAYTDIRNEGREPVCRVFHGALTRPEIDAYDPSNWTEVVVPRTINESERLHVNVYAEHSEDDNLCDPIDNLADDHPMSMVEDTLLDENAFEATLDRLAELLNSELESNDASFHQEVMHDRFVKEMTIREIAEARGAEPEKISVALNRVRDMTLRARDDGAFDDLLTAR